MARQPNRESTNRAVASAFAANVGAANDPIIILKVYVWFAAMEQMYREMFPEF